MERSPEIAMAEREKTARIILIPGLSDGPDVWFQVMRRQRAFADFDVELFKFGWQEGVDFEERKNDLLEVIDRDPRPTFLMGVSAGGGVTVVAKSERPDIPAIVNSCGRLREGVGVKPRLEDAARKSPAFVESTFRCQDCLEDFTPEMRSDSLTFRPTSDRRVPASTVGIEGADNRVVPVRGHLMGIAYVHLFRAEAVADFLRSRVSDG